MGVTSEVSIFPSKGTVPSAPGLGVPLGQWLWCLNSRLTFALSRKLKAHNVSAGEWFVLRELSVVGEISQARLGRRLGMTRASISRYAKSLCTKALVEARTDLHDRRAVTMSVTSTGQRLIPVLATLAEQNDVEFFGHLTPEEQTTVRTMLGSIVDVNSFRGAGGRPSSSSLNNGCT